jgi:hypothetical protein
MAVWAAYQAWCEQRDYSAISHAKFGRLARWRKDRVGGTVWYMDAELAEGYVGLAPVCGPKALPAPATIVKGHPDGALKAFPVLMCDRGRRRPAVRHSRFNHFVADCIAHKSRCGRDLELTQDRCSVGLNRLQADVEQLRYRLACVALGDQLDKFELGIAVCEAFRELGKSSNPSAHTIIKILQRHLKNYLRPDWQEWVATYDRHISSEQELEPEPDVELDTHKEGRH